MCRLKEHMSQRSCARRKEVGLLLLDGQSWGFQGILAMYFLTFKNAYISFRFKIEAEIISCYRSARNKYFNSLQAAAIHNEH